MKRKCLDLIPVDLVCRGMTLISAALVARRHKTVYQLATSVANACNMRRSIELTGLGHRKFYRAQNNLEHRLRLKFDAIPVSKTRYKTLSAPMQKAIVQAINRTVEPFASKPPLARQERDLERVVKLISLFEPFILYNDHVFEAANVERLSAALPANERADFGYDVRASTGGIIGSTCTFRRCESGVILSSRAVSRKLVPGVLCLLKCALELALRGRRAQTRRRRPDIQSLWLSS